MIYEFLELIVNGFPFVYPLICVSIIRYSPHPTDTVPRNKINATPYFSPLDRMPSEIIKISGSENSSKSELMLSAIAVLSGTSWSTVLQKEYIGLAL